MDATCFFLKVCMLPIILFYDRHYRFFTASHWLETGPGRVMQRHQSFETETRTILRIWSVQTLFAVADEAPMWDWARHGSITSLYGNQRGLLLA